MMTAGDFGSLELADEIAAFKPLRGVYGNIDGGIIRRVYPEFTLFEVEGVKVLMTHIGGYPRHYQPKARQHIYTSKPKIFIAGHSHILKVMYDNVYDLLHINPGAAGNYGIHHVRTAIRLDIDNGEIKNLEIAHFRYLNNLFSYIPETGEIPVVSKYFHVKFSTFRPLHSL